MNLPLLILATVSELIVVPLGLGVGFALIFGLLTLLSRRTGQPQSIRRARHSLRPSDPKK
jgi:nitrate reductase gamma subunit